MKINGTLVFEASTASEIQNLCLQKVASLPGVLATDIGRLIYSTGNNSIYVGTNTDGILSWVQIATGGDASALVAEVDRVETALGLNSTGSFNPAAFSGNLAGQTSYVGLINTLQNLVATVTSSSAAETTRATNAEAGLNTRVDNAVAATTAEVSRALSAESSLSNRISTEVNERTTAVNAVAGNLSTEVAARSSADTNLQNAISAEVTRATQQESAIRSEMASAISGLTWIAPINFMVSNHLTVTTASVGNRVLNLTNFTVYQVTAVNAGTPTYGPGKALVDGTAFFFTNNGAGYVFNGSAVVQFNGASAVTAGMGLIKTGNVLDINSDTGTISVTADSIDVATNVLNSITANTTAITGEISRASIAEANLTSRINTAEAGLVSDITAETNRATDAEQSLEDSIFSTAASTISRLTPAYQATPPTEELFEGKTWINSTSGKLYYYFYDSSNNGTWVEYFASQVVDNSDDGGTVVVPGGDGTGNGRTAQVVLVPNSNNEITFNKSQGNSFFVNAKSSIIVRNPVGYSPGEDIRLFVKQDSVGSRTVNFDTLFAVPNAQPPVMSTAPDSLDRIDFDALGDGTFAVTPYVQNYGVVTAFARIGTTTYLRLGGPPSDGVFAFNVIKSGDTCVIIRNGKGPEATGTLLGPSTVDVISPTQVTTATPRTTYTVVGAPVNGERPLITMLPNTRPAYGKAVLNIEGNTDAEIRDLKITGARNDDMDARGIAPNSGGKLTIQNVTIKNVEITNCNNGILWGNETFGGTVTIIDCNLNGNGIGGNPVSGGASTSGFTHNLYGGRNDALLTVLRSTFQNAEEGHNFKSRAWKNKLDQVLCYNGKKGRELNMPNGGEIEATNCIFHKLNIPSQGNLIGIGEETILESRTRKYVFRNCTFINDITGAGRDVTFFINFDKQYAMEFIDCKFEGPIAATFNGDPNSEYPGMTCINGIRYWPNVPPVFTLTGGPIGPVLPVGYFPIAMTPVTA
jgi:hypothetical protein